jgi:hypothetical protein
VTGGLLFLLAALAPGAASAHATERAVILTMPTGYYLAGAAAAVALTALAAAAAPRLPDPRPVRLLARRVLVPRAASSWLACILLWALVAVGVLGSRDPLRNPLVHWVWTFLWVALPLACIFLGNLARPINPWFGPVRTARRLLGRSGGIGLDRLGHWPAVAGLFAFAWFEIVSLAPADPANLARVVAGYWVIVFLLALLEGEGWLDRGETFGAYFGLVGRIAPLWHETEGARTRLMAGLPGTQVLAMPPLGASGAAFVTLALAAVTFDGLSETFWWLARIGVNPLEFPGRSAVQGVNTLGLLAAWGLVSGSILGAIALGRRLAGRTTPFGADAGPWMLSFLPIAAGYHVAHYLVALLTDGQYAIVALGDPFDRGWNPFGLPQNWVSFGMLSHIDAVRTIWNIQFTAILAAHLLAVLLGLKLAVPARPVAHAPMTVLMVLYTILGLWLLSTATAG